MAIPDYADERSYKFFSRGYVGPNSGEDGTPYRTSADSRHEGLKPSKTYSGWHCVYCGNRAYPIQPHHLGYDVSGYWCPCKDAMDEIENNLAIEELKEKHYSELQALKNKAPVPSVEVKRNLIKSKLEDDHYLDRAMKALNITN